MRKQARDTSFLALWVSHAANFHIRRGAKAEPHPCDSNLIISKWSQLHTQSWLIKIWVLSGWLLWYRLNSDKPIIYRITPIVSPLFCPAIGPPSDGSAPSDLNVLRLRPNSFIINQAADCMKASVRTSPCESDTDQRWGLRKSILECQARARISCRNNHRELIFHLSLFIRTPECRSNIEMHHAVTGQLHCASYRLRERFVSPCRPSWFIHG